MKKIVVLLSGLFLTSLAFAQQISDPNAQVRDVKEFHAIHIGDAFDVYLTQGNEEKVVVSAKEQRDVAEIIVEVKNGILYVNYDHHAKWRRGNKKLKAYISFKEINELEISGACDVDIAGSLTTHGNLRVELSGASDLSGTIDVSGTLSFELNGASDAKLTGRASEMKIDASGASRFRGFDFAVDYCNAKASGASDIRLTVNKELSANASGASELNYKGDGVIRDIKTTGASKISRS